MMTPPNAVGRSPAFAPLMACGLPIQSANVSPTVVERTLINQKYNVISGIYTRSDRLAELRGAFVVAMASL
jgi:hypothetical protein